MTLYGKIRGSYHRQVVLFGGESDPVDNKLYSLNLLLTTCAEAETQHLHDEQDGIEGPEPRSESRLVYLTAKSKNWLVTMFGERGINSLAHAVASAGKCWGSMGLKYR